MVSADKELLKLARDLVTCSVGLELVPTLTDKSDTFREELAIKITIIVT